MATYYKAFTSTWRDDVNYGWTTEIWIRSSPISIWPIQLEMGEGGPEIKYDTKGEERFNPIIGSKLTIPFIIPSYGSYQEYFIDRVIKNLWGEEDVYIRQYNGNRIIWQGFVLMDLDSIKDVDYPMTVELVATDGLGRLNDMEWLPKGLTTASGHDVSAYETWADRGFARFTEWVFYCMRYTGRINNVDGNSMWDDNTSNILSTTVNWYNSQMGGDVSDYDPFHESMGRSDQFQKLDFETQKLKVGKVSEVLHHILKAWGARLIYWQDKWFIIQVKELDVSPGGSFAAPTNIRAFLYTALNGGTLNIKKDYTGNTNFSRFNITLKNRTAPRTGSQKLAGGKYTHYPPLQEVKTNLVHEGSQNVFPGMQLYGGMHFWTGTNSLAGGLTPVGKAMEFLSGPFVSSTNYKFETELFINCINNTTPSTTPSSYDTVPYQVWQGVEIAAKAPLSKLWLSSLTFSQTTQQMAWHDIDQQEEGGCTYDHTTGIVHHSGALLPITGEYCFMPVNWSQWKLIGTVIDSENFYISSTSMPTTSITGTVYLSSERVLKMVSLATPGINSLGTITAPYLPRFEFDGLRDLATNYYIRMAEPTYLSQGTAYVPGGTPPSMFNMYSLATTSNIDFTNPLNPIAQQPPTWSSGVANPFLSTIHPVGSGSTGQFSSTLVVSALTDNSKILDNGKTYWGDGPEYFSNCALQVYDFGTGDWVFSDWTNKNWRRGAISGGTGYSFTEMLNQNILTTQAAFVWKANFNLARAQAGTLEVDGSGSVQDYINPICRLLDVKQSQDDKDRWFVFRRGTLNLNASEFKGEWFEIETNSDPVINNGNTPDNVGNYAARTAAGNLADFSQTGINALARVSVGVDQTLPEPEEGETDPYLGTTTLTTLTISNPLTTLKSGDIVALIMPTNPLSYRLTLTADLDLEDTTISFEETIFSGSVPPGSSLFVDAPDLIQQYQHKTRGTMGGFTIDEDGIMKGGIEITGFLDSDSMEGASSSNIPTAGSVKTYADTKQGELTLTTVGSSGAASLVADTLNIPNYAARLRSVSFTVSTEQEIGSGGDVGGKEDYTIIAFDTAAGGVAVASPFSVDSEGVIKIEENGTYLINFSVATTVSGSTNRILAGAMAYKEIDEEITELTGTMVFNYDRGTAAGGGGVSYGSVYEGSGSGSYILKVDEIEGETEYITAWIGFWIDGRASTATGITIVQAGTIINIIQIVKS